MAWPLVPVRQVPMQVVRWIVRSALAERMRWPLWWPVALGAGVGLYFALPFEPVWPAAFVSAGLAIVAAVFAGSTRHAGVRMALLLLAAVAIGFTLAKVREEVAAAPVLQAPIGPIAFEGRVEYAQSHGKGIRVLVRDVDIDGADRADGPSKVRVSFRRGAETLRPGDRIRATAVLMPPPAPAEPDAYDFGRTAFFNGIGAVGYAYGRPELLERPSQNPLVDTLATGVERLRWTMTQRIHDVLPGSTGSIAAALITGDRGGISETDEQSLRDAGLAHVLAIAGLHMALVGLGLFWIVRAALAAWPYVALHYPIKKWAAVAALGGATFYLIISGAAAPTIRAFTMLAMMLLAVLLDRPALSMRSVALASAIILFIAPESLTEPGFQMSFAAVVGLIAVAEWEQARATRHEQFGPRRFAAVRRYMRGIATTSFVGSIATLPYAIFHFDRATHFAVLGNLLAMPIMGFVVMPAAALSVALMPLGLDAGPLHVMGWGIEAMLAVGHWVSTLPGAVSVLAAWPVSALVLISLGGLWCAIWRRDWRWLGLAPIAVGVSMAFTAKAPDLLIGRDGETIALRGADGTLQLLRPARDSYSADEWLKRDGDERIARDAVATPDGGVRCDALGCIARMTDGTLLAAPMRIDALAEDCAKATILIGPASVRGCDGPKLILDKSQIVRAGGYAVWLAPYRLVSVEERRGRRPWSSPPAMAPSEP